MIRQALAVAAAALLTGGAAFGVTEIHFWHSMAGTPGERLVELAERFNASQSAYRLVPVFKGSYADSLRAALDPARAAEAPHIVQALDTATEAIVAAKQAVKPVHQLMSETREPFDPRAYLPAVSEQYVDGRGRLLALPFNGGTAVLYFNKDAFRAAGLDSERAPRTWRQVQEAALKLQETDAAPCAYTTGWPSWVYLENLAAWHNEPVASRDNGHRGADAKLTFNGELMVRHISLMSSWRKSGLFAYAGRAGEGDALFARGECAMLTTSSAAYAEIAGVARFAFTMSPLPYYDEFSGAPFNTLVHGAGLWVLSGKKPVEYRGVAKFLGFFSRPDVQAEWHQRTGFLPITAAAHELTRTQGYYDRHPGTDVPLKQLGRRASANSRAPRLRSFVEIRALLEEEMEAVWSERKTPKEALDAAVERGNALLRRVERARGR